MKKSGVILLLIIFVMIMAGCQTAAKKPVIPDNNMSNTDNTARTQLTEVQKQSMVKRLSNVAESVSGVSNATVIVTDTLSTTSPTTTPGTVNPGNTGSDYSVDDTRSFTTGEGTQNTKVMVMVGLNVDSGAMQSATRLNQIQQTVADRIKSSDRRVDQVLVTTKTDLVGRINNIATSTSNGKAVQRDITDLKREMTNQAPTL